MREALNRICALLLRTLSLIQFHFSNSGLSLDFDFLETSGERFLGNSFYWCTLPNTLVLRLQTNSFYHGWYSPYVAQSSACVALLIPQTTLWE